MLHEYSKELKDKVRKELIELLEYDPAPSGSLQKIAAAHSIPITTVYSCPLCQDCCRIKVTNKGARNGQIYNDNYLFKGSKGSST